MNLSIAKQIDLFYKKYQSSNLGPFYIFNSDSILFLHHIVEKFLEKLSIKAPDFLHSDLLWLKPEAAKFSVEEINSLFKALSYNPNKLPYRIIILDDSSKLNTTCSNKLLKLLEEPGDKNIFIMLNQTGSSILPTISSRAIELSFYEEDAHLNRDKSDISKIFRVEDQVGGARIEHKKTTPAEDAGLYYDGTAN